MVRNATALWLSVIQVLVVALAAALSWPEYSQASSYISELGTSRSPLSVIVNLSIAIGGLCLGVGAVLWRRLGVLDPVMTAGFLIAATGLVSLAACPLDSPRAVIHGIAANMFYAFAPVTILATSAYSLVAQRHLISATIAFACGALASAGWVAQATSVFEAEKGAVQRWIAIFVVIGVCALALHLQSWAAGRRTGDRTEGRAGTEAGDQANSISS